MSHARHVAPHIGPKMHVVIVGAGINGLVAANYLRRPVAVHDDRASPPRRGACVLPPGDRGVRGLSHGPRCWPDADFVSRRPGSLLASRLCATPSSIHFPGQTSDMIWRGRRLDGNSNGLRERATPSLPRRRGKSRRIPAAGLSGGTSYDGGRRRGRAGSTTDTPLDHR